VSKLFIIAILTLGLSGCATQKELNDSRAYSAELMQHAEEWHIRAVVLKAEIEDIKRHMSTLIVFDNMNKKIIEKLTEEKEELEQEAVYLATVLGCIGKSNTSKHKNFASFAKKNVNKCIANYKKLIEKENE